MSLRKFVGSLLVGAGLFISNEHLQNVSMSEFQPRGKYHVEHWRAGEHIADYDIPNGIVTVGKNSLLDVGFRAQTQITAWYIGIIDNSGFSALADADTAASHGGWNEFTTYSEANRVQWSPAAAASGQISNSSSSNFNITGTGTLKGIFLISNNTKSGTTGTLWATAAFASNVSVVNGDLLKITYTITS